MELKRIGKKAVLNMLLPALLWVAVLVFAAFILNSFIADSFVWKRALWAAVTAVSVLLLVQPFVRFHRYRYLINETHIVAREGLFFITTTMAPIERVHQLTVLQGPIDRLTGLAKVEAVTAGGEITVRFLPLQTARQLTELLEQRIQIYAKGQS